MNLPNKISLSRIFLVPVVMFFYLEGFFEYGKIIAFLLFVIAVSTDFVDGMIARRTNQVTSLGKFLDESADKLLTTAVLVMLLADNMFISQIFGIIAVFSILARDQVVGFVRRLCAGKGIIIAADKLGKIKTILLDVALSLFMLLAVCDKYPVLPDELLEVIVILTYFIFLSGLVMNIISGINYCIKNKDCFKD